MNNNNEKKTMQGDTPDCMKQVYNYMGKSQLAEVLFPHITPKSQLNALRHFINRNERLLEELEETSYNPKCRVLTPLQVSIIKKHMFGPLLP